MNRAKFLLAALGVIAFAGPSNAHHSDAIYDREVTVAGEGVVTRYTYRNPHVLIGVELENNDGEIVEWLVETGSTPIMNRSGWSADMLSPGDRINVRLHPERIGNLHGILHSHETSEGEVFMQIEDAAVETVPAESLAGFVSRRNSHSTTTPTSAAYSYHASTSSFRSSGRAAARSFRS